MQAGALVETFSLGLEDYVIPAYYTIASAEASSNLARFDGVKYGRRAEKAPEDGLHEMYKKSRTEGFGPEVRRRILLGTFALSSGYYDAYYLKALKVRTLVQKAFDRAFEKYDVLLAPAAPTTKKCPYCLSEIPVEATRCPHCTSQLEESKETVHA